VVWGGWQVYRSTADAAAATALFGRVTAITPQWLALRDLVIAKRKPRSMFVQVGVHGCGFAPRPT
jgi:hypothetical protein